MDVSLLREQYRSTRERQRRQTQVLLFRKVSEELSEAVSIIPVTQGLTSPPPAITVDPDLSTCDPWHVHLGLHRRSCPGVTVRVPATNTSVTGSSGCSSTSSYEAVGWQQESRGRKLAADSTSDSPCSSFNSSKEEDPFRVEGSIGDSVGGSKVDPVQISVTGSPRASEQNSSDGSGEGPPDESQESSAPGSLTGSDDSSTPVVSITCSPSSSATNLHEDLKENGSTDVKTSDGVQQTRGSPAQRDSRKDSVLALRFTRQLSVGGLGSSSGVHQNQNYYPFPNRRTPRISEAAKKLGMYSSF
ncbi:uncharacterized protein C9orf152-like isoform X2 [Xiphias gladius]|nr:uncharacterized protein C9orf152-like isoform X2 [Xiphias gladius]